MSGDSMSPTNVIYEKRHIPKKKQQQQTPERYGGGHRKNSIVEFIVEQKLNNSKCTVCKEKSGALKFVRKMEPQIFKRYKRY